MVDTIGQQSDLYFRRTCIGLCEAYALDDFLFVLQHSDIPLSVRYTLITVTGNERFICLVTVKPYAFTSLEILPYF